MSVPSNVAWVTRSISGIGGGILRCLEAGRWKIISSVLPVLIVSLFLADQAQILSYSRIISTELFVHLLFTSFSGSILFCSLLSGNQLYILGICNNIITRGQSNLTKSASRGAHSPVRGHPGGRKLYH